MAIRFDEIQLANTAHKFYPKLQGAGSAQYLQIQTSHGYLKLGPNNSSYAHFYTDRGAYYFNQNVSFDGNIAGYDGNETATFSVYYDSADTNYYCDPNGQSRLSTLNLGSSPTSGITSGYIAQIRGNMHMTNNTIDYVNQLHFHDNVRFVDEGNDSYLRFKFGDNSFGGIKFYDGTDTLHGTFYADGNDSIGILDAHGNWAVQVDLDTLTGLKVNDVYRLKANTSGVLLGADTAASKTTVRGHLGIGDATYPKIAYPGQNALWGGTGSTTGQIVIDLPGTLANFDMMYMEIDIYEYSSDHATKVIVGGHNWNSGGNSNTSTTQWYNAGVRVIGSMSKPVYLGRRNDGSNERRCIAIGDTDSTWSYATVHVSKVHGAEFYSSAIDWIADWNIAQTTSTSYFTKNPTTNFNLVTSTTLRTAGRFYAPYIQAGTEMLAPIFYDSNDTTYYTNPASTSSIRKLEVHDGTVWDATTQGTGKGSIHIDPNVSTDHGGGSITFGASDTSSGTTAQGGIYVRTDGSYGTRMYLSTTDSYASGSKTTVRLESAGGLYVDRGSVYSPVFYDKDNTGAYVNPAGDSAMHSIGIDDYLFHNGDGDTHILFTTDRQTYTAGAVEFIDFANTTQDYITLGGSSDIDTRLQGGSGYIFIQGSNGYIGVNDATPSYPLDINANTYISGTITSTGAAVFNDGITLGGSNETMHLLYNNTSNYKGTLGWSWHQFGNNGSNDLVAGNTGAGGYFRFIVNNTNNCAADTAPNGSTALTIASDMRATFGEDIIANGIYVGSRNASYDFYNNGTTYLNGATIVDDNLTLSASGTTTRYLYVSQDTDYGRAVIGRAALGKLGWDDHAGFAHVDHNTQSNYALLQNNNGDTFINVPSNRTGYFRVNNATIGSYTSNGLSFNKLFDTNDTSYYLDPYSGSVLEGLIGYRQNKASMASWTEGGTGNQTGYFGGNFSGSEITTKWADGPGGARTIVAETSGDTGNDYDGGYVKAFHNLDINKSHLSVVYIKRISSAGTGNVYHGTGAGTNQITNLSNTSNTNPYFHYPNLGSFPQDVWCVSIGVIQANNDDNTDASLYTGANALQGIYRLDTGQKILNSSNAWKMGSAGASLSNGNRFFHYYSTDASAKLQWAKPGFWEINGDEPSLADLLLGVPGNSGGGVYTSGSITANIFYDWANTAYYVDPASTSNLNDVEAVQLAIDSYIYHKGDTDTYFGFDTANSIRFVAGNSERLKITGDVNVSGATDLTIPTGRRIKFDGAGGHTYIMEEGDNNMKFYVGGTEHMAVGGGDIWIQQPMRITQYIYHTGDLSTQINFESSQITIATSGGSHIQINNDENIYFRTNGTNRFKMDTSGNFIATADIIAYGSVSDVSYKENIKPITGALNLVDKLQGVTFDWKEDTDTNKMVGIKEDIGFIAQDVEKVLPTLVRENENGKLSIRDKGIVPVLVEAIKELKAEIEELKKQIK
jgi:hypothetical protein